MESTLSQLETLSRETHRSETEMMALALQKGVEQLWRERLLGRYLRNDITRDEAVEAVGLDWVETAERQRVAMLEDVSWALER